MANTRLKWAAKSALVWLMTAVILAAWLSEGAEARVRRIRYSPAGERFTQRGLAVEVGLGGVQLESDIPDFCTEKSGPGIVLGLSYGLSDQVALFGTLTVSGFETDCYEDRSAGYGDLGVKFSLVSSGRQRTQPYIAAALGGAAYNDGLGHEYTGSAFRLGGGIDHFITPRMILFVEAGFWSGQYEEVRQEGCDYSLADEPDFNSSAIMVGLRFRL